MKQIRNIAIIAHVDHGKTTLVDQLLKQSNIFRKNQVVQDCFLDSASARLLDKNSIIFAVTPDGKIAYGGKEIGLGGVRPTVKRLCAKEPLPVVIQADDNARSGMVIRVIDEAKLGGAMNVSIATEES